MFAGRSKFSLEDWYNTACCDEKTVNVGSDENNSFTAVILIVYAKKNTTPIGAFNNKNNHSMIEVSSFRSIKYLHIIFTNKKNHGRPKIEISTRNWTYNARYC